MAKYTKGLLEKSIRILQPYQDAPLSEEAAREVLDNLTALLLYLHELEQKYGPKADV